MGLEIERKFCVTDFKYREEAKYRSEFIQFYLSKDPERIVRVRLVGQSSAIITIKSIPVGITRNEYEYEIPFEDGFNMLKLAIGNPIHKTRYFVPVGNDTWEVDEFKEGYTIAEIELKSEDGKFEKPSWLGKEVTGDPKYYNSNL